LQPSAGDNTNIAYLHREIMLLKNDLNFERYLKQQHLSHIGKLRRMQVREATVEAETQNLINANKILKGKLEEAKNITAQTKRESEKSRAQSRKWEQDLTAKLRAIRQDQKKWTLESEHLRRDLEESKVTCEELKQLVVESEARESDSSQKLQSIKHELSGLEKLRADVDDLMARLRQQQASEQELERAKAREEVARTRTELLEMQLSARDDVLAKTRQASAREIERLKAELEDAVHDAQSRATKNFQAMLDSALAASRARLAEAQKTHAHLLRRFTEVQQQCLVLQEQRDAAGPLLRKDVGGYEAHSPKEYRRDPYRAARGEGQKLEYRVPSDEGRSLYRSLSHDNPVMNTPTRVRIEPRDARTVRAGSLDATMATEGRGEEPPQAARAPKIKPQSEMRVYGRGRSLLDTSFF
jgi:DNA repair exonuclease SbcCD ATPase subunit